MQNISKIKTERAVFVENRLQRSMWCLDTNVLILKRYVSNQEINRQIFRYHILIYLYTHYIDIDNFLSLEGLKFLNLCLCI